MVDISRKAESVRTAVASGRIRLKRETVARIRDGSVEKGDVLTVAKIAGVSAAKNTWNTLPLCHQIPLRSIRVDAELEREEVVVHAEVKAVYSTGVEMEALHAAAVALLTVWDMTKQYEKDDQGQYPSTVITQLKVDSKTKEEE